MAPMALMASVALVAPMAPMALLALMAPMARVALMAPIFGEKFVRSCFLTTLIKLLIDHKSPG